MKPLCSVLFTVLFTGCEVHSHNDCPQCRPTRRVDVRVEVNRRPPKREMPPRDVKYRVGKASQVVMDLPISARQRNYDGGSCVCASTISLLRWQGRDADAAKVRQHCSGGQGSDSLHAKLDRLGIRYAYTTSGDVRFLEWAIRTRRGAGITFYPGHFVNLVGLTKTTAVLLDNNRVERYITLPRREFEQRWRAYGGWATTVVYAPPPPPAYRAHQAAAGRSFQLTAHRSSVENPEIKP